MGKTPMKASSMKAIRMRATPKTSKLVRASPMKSMKKKGTTGASASTISGDASIDACLALVPYKSDHGMIHVPESPETASVSVKRAPPALTDLQNNGTWNHPQQQAVLDHLDSLIKKHPELDGLLEQYRGTRSEEKRKFALNLCLAKNVGDLKVMEKESFSESFSDTTEMGWQSAFQIWKHEGIPVTDNTIQLRLACLAPLICREHSNPVRAKLGELEFWFTRDLMSRNTRTHSKGFETRATGDVNREDYDKCRDNLSKASGKVAVKDAAPRAPARKRASAPDFATMSQKEKKTWETEQVKLTWIKEVKLMVGKLDKAMNEMNSQVDHCTRAKVPYKLIDSLKLSKGEAEKHKVILQKALDNDQPALDYGKPKLVKSKSDADNLIKDIYSKEKSKPGLIERAKSAVLLMKSI